MSRSDVEDPKLAEVKAILAKLQRISADDDADVLPAPPATPRQMAPAMPTVVAAAIRPMPPPLPSVAMPQPSRPPLSMKAMLAGALAAAGVVYLAYPHLLHKQPPSASPPQPAAEIARNINPVVPQSKPTATTETPTSRPALLSEKENLREADRLIRAGRIAEGRAQLQAAGADRFVDLSWALARAYDPNVIGEIGGADAKPDVDEAAKWYRRWHALAQAQGLVSDGVSVERIIRAMPR